jgi:hypothetical protein
MQCLWECAVVHKLWGHAYGVSALEHWIVSVSAGLYSLLMTYLMPRLFQNRLN